jgi:hypothetical protein
MHYDILEFNTSSLSASVQSTTGPDCVPVNLTWRDITTAAERVVGLGKLFLVLPFYLQFVSAHSANCAKLVQCHV